jgi:hypothetical protein
MTAFARRYRAALFLDPAADALDRGSVMATVGHGFKHCAPTFSIVLAVADRSSLKHAHGRVKGAC